MRTDDREAVEHVNTAGQTVIVDVVLTNNTHRDAVMHLARGHVHALRHQQVSGRKRDRIFVIDQVLWVRSRCRTNEGHGSVVSREAVNSSQGACAGSEDRTPRSRRACSRSVLPVAVGPPRTRTRAATSAPVEAPLELRIGIVRGHGFFFVFVHLILLHRNNSDSVISF